MLAVYTLFDLVLNWPDFFIFSFEQFNYKKQSLEMFYKKRYP